MYNAEAFIGKCLDSCLEQKPICDFEIIVINDGSTDNGPELVKEYMKRSTLIKMKTQPNGGLSSARNAGLNIAQGQYVWFVDADDWISYDSLALLKPAFGSEPDIIPIRSALDSNGKIRNKIPCNCKTGKDVLMTRNWEHCAPFYIFNRTFLVRYSLSFFVGIYHEDSEFTPRALYFAQSIVVIPSVLYYVYPNINSITRSLIAKKSYDYITVCNNLFQFNEEVVVEDVIHKRFYDTISMLINNALANIVLFESGDQIRFNTLLRDNKCILKSLSRSSLKYRVEYVLFTMFPKRYVQIYSVLKQIDHKQ